MSRRGVLIALALTAACASGPGLLADRPAACAAEALDPDHLLLRISAAGLLAARGARDPSALIAPRACRMGARPPVEPRLVATWLELGLATAPEAVDLCVTPDAEPRVVGEIRGRLDRAGVAYRVGASPPDPPAPCLDRETLCGALEGIPDVLARGLYPELRCDRPPWERPRGGATRPIEPRPQDGLTRREITAAIRARADHLRSCLSRAERPYPARAVVVTFEVGPDGSVGRAHAQPQAGVPSAVTGCLTDLVRMTPFPAPRGGQPVVAGHRFSIGWMIRE